MPEPRRDARKRDLPTLTALAERVAALEERLDASGLERRVRWGCQTHGVPIFDDSPTAMADHITLFGPCVIVARLGQAS